ncbi:hypothetical protein ACKAV7_005481 [Fusarium commune]
MIASAASGLIAYGILQMRGIAGLSGWQWMFLLEGIYHNSDRCCFRLSHAQLSRKPVKHFRSLILLTTEIHILTNRVTIDTLLKVQDTNMSSGLTSSPLSPGGVSTRSVTVSSAASPLSHHSEHINRPLLQATAMIVFKQTHSHLLASRGLPDLPVNRSCPEFRILLLTGLRAIGTTSTNRDLKYGILTCTTLWGSVAHPLNGSWLAVNIRNPAERSITMALLIMTANAAGLAGAQIFQAHDAPLYRTGFTVILTLASIALVFAIVSNAQYLWLNKKLAAKGRLEEGQVEAAGEGDKWRFSI